MTQEGKVTGGGVLGKKVAEIGGKVPSIFEHGGLSIQKRYITTLECFVEVLEEQKKVMKNIQKALNQ